MARGLRRGDAGEHLITFHPTGGSGSAEWFHEEDWLDFNMRQNGHGAEFERYAVHPLRLRPRSHQAGDRRRAALRGPPGFLQTQGAGLFRLPPTCAGRSTGTCSAALSGTLTDITPFGRCGSRAVIRSTARSCRGTKRSISRRRPDAVCAAPDRVAAFPDPSRRRLHTSRGQREGFCSRRRARALRGHARRDRQLRNDLCARGRRFRVHMNKIAGVQVTAWWFNPGVGRRP